MWYGSHIVKILNVYYTSLLIIAIFPTTIAWAEEITNINNSYSSLLNDTNVDFATNIEFIKCHLSAAISNKQAGNNELAETHSFHPIAEIYTLIRDQLSSADNRLNNTLINSLNNLTPIVYTSTSAEFSNSASSVKNLLYEAIIKVIPENEITDIKFNMSIWLIYLRLLNQNMI